MTASRPSGGIHANVAANNLVQVSARLDGRFNSRLNATCFSGAQLASSGTEYEYSATGSLTNSTTWLDAGSAGDVWAEWTRTGGTLSDWNSLTPGSGRHQLSTTRSWRIVRSTIGTNTIIGYWTLWDAASGGSALQTTTGATWSAWYEFDPCPLCCFTPDTLIKMARGIDVPIGSVRPGDEIVVRDPDNGELTTAPVGEIIVRENRPMFRIHFEDGRYIDASEDHPFSVQGKGVTSINPTIEYKDLGIPNKLYLGDKVSSYGGGWVRVVRIEPLNFSDAVYTFSNSLFFANGLLVY